MIMEIIYIVISITVTFLATSIPFMRSYNKSYLALKNEQFETGVAAFRRGYDLGVKYTLDMPASVIDILKHDRSLL